MKKNILKNNYILLKFLINIVIVIIYIIIYPFYIYLFLYCVLIFNKLSNINSLYIFKQILKLY